MKIQIRYISGEIRNEEVIDDIIRIMEHLKNPLVQKVSFDLFDARLVLRPDGTYQIFGGAINHPSL